MHSLLKVLLLSFIATASVSHAQEKSGESSRRARVLNAVNHYTDASTLAVGYADLDPTWIEGVQTEIVKRLGEEQGGEIAANPGFGVTRTLVGGLRASGAREAVVLLGADDIQLQGGPLVVVTCALPGDAAKVQPLLGGLVEMSGENELSIPTLLDGRGNVLLGTRATVERYQKLAVTARTDLTIPLGKKLDEALIAKLATSAVVVAPGSDVRRVIRELWPALPEPFAKATGPLIADNLRQLTLSVTRPPEWRLQVELEASTSDSAETFATLIESAYQRGEEAVRNETPNLAQAAAETTKLLAPKRRGNSLIVSLAHDNRQAEQLFRQVFLPAVGKARAAAQRNQRMNNMKQIALAMLNYESANGHYPAAAPIVDKDGKPLLSWRVAILPYLENSALADQFHLDEPWDSPHNLKLARTVPAVYIHPDLTELASEGKTVYQVPDHSESVFGPPEEAEEPEKRSWGGRIHYRARGMQIRSVKDGTSNTVLVVETPPEDAVVWTKPADWEVDLAIAWQQLKGKGTTADTAAAFCDGHARCWDHSENLAENLPKLITRDGGEIVEW